MHTQAFAKTGSNQNNERNNEHGKICKRVETKGSKRPFTKTGSGQAHGKLKNGGGGGGGGFWGVSRRR
jgi:hypothetical protein